jgi:TPR repeat protein
MFNYGATLAEGEGVEKDEIAAVAWYRRAAEQGYANGQFDLGMMLDNGRGVEKDEAAAVA